MTKIPYEPPLIIDLTGRAMAQDSSGFLFDSQASGKKCKAGSAAGGSVCATGGTPQFDCGSGATATGSKCVNGSVAGAQCMSGSAAQANQCNAGSAATTQCKAGSVAGSKCKAGSAVA